MDVLLGGKINILLFFLLLPQQSLVLYKLLFRLFSCQKSKLRLVYYRRELAPNNSLERSDLIFPVFESFLLIPE